LLLLEGKKVEDRKAFPKTINPSSKFKKKKKKNLCVFGYKEERKREQT